jgi:hypothetical protein
MRRVGAADVARHVDVVERTQRGALRQAARQDHLAQREVGVLPDVAFELVAKALRLGAVLQRLVLRQVHALLRKAQDVAMSNMITAHRIVSDHPDLDAGLHMRESFPNR